MGGAVCAEAIDSAAVAIKVLGACVQGTEQIKARDAASRSGAELAVERDEDRGTVVALDDS